MPEAQDKRDAEWVRQLNELSRKMDEIGQSVHPGAILEATAELRDKYHNLARKGPK